jgi:dCMP deaminase
MARPSFYEIYMRMALLMAERSTCERLQVGAVITTQDFRQVLAVGYNGSAAGQPNGCESLAPGACGHLHAEENAAISCVAHRKEPKIVFCTNLPCEMCAKRLINLGGVVRVIYFDDYRIRKGADILLAGGIKVLSYEQQFIEDVVDRWHEGKLGGGTIREALRKVGYAEEEVDRWSSGELEEVPALVLTGIRQFMTRI